MNLKETIFNANQVIKGFPQSKNGHRYIKLKSGRKLFLNRFIKKYGIDGTPCHYATNDLKRRISKIEFFDFFVKDCELKPSRIESKLILESRFHKMVIIIKKVNKANRYELISFYPK